MPRYRYRCLACRYSLEGHKDRGSIIRCPECGYENDLDDPALDEDWDETDPPGLSAVIQLSGSILVFIWGCIMSYWFAAGALIAGLALLLGIVMWMKVSHVLSDLTDKSQARGSVVRCMIYTVGVCMYISVAIAAAVWLAGVAGRKLSSDVYRLALIPVAMMPFVIVAWACRSLLVRWLEAFQAMYEALDQTEPRP